MDNPVVFNGGVDELSWSTGYFRLYMSTGVAQPTQTQLIIRDANFGAVLTLNIPNGDWFYYLEWWCVTLACAANPFPNGATRWITWA